MKQLHGVPCRARIEVQAMREAEMKFAVFTQVMAVLLTGVVVVLILLAVSA